MDTGNDGEGENKGTLTPLPSRALSTQLRDELESAKRYSEKSRANSTVAKYENCLKGFDAYCLERDLPNLPTVPMVVAVYLGWLADTGHAHSTCCVHVAAIDWRHRQNGYSKPSKIEEDVSIAEILSGIKRDQALRKKLRKRALQAEHIISMIEKMPNDDSRSRRDRAILAFGVASAMRRSEIVALNMEDLEFSERGVRIAIRKSKTDQAGAGEEIAIPVGEAVRPVSHLKKWIEIRGTAPGPVFTRFDQRGLKTLLPMSDRAIARLVKQYALAADVDPREIGAHSMRAGFLTDAAENDVSIAKMQQVSRHKSVDILMQYVRSADLFKDHAGERFL